MIKMRTLKEHLQKDTNIETLDSELLIVIINSIDEWVTNTFSERFAYYIKTKLQ
jgi:adenosyl cobinamide kinase/adenosyl cobinamide phosphate guanylyltransferase